LLQERARPRGHQFVGSAVCGECHTKAHAIWEKTPHQHATESIVHPKERSEIPRHFDPECLSCHVTGWEPQKYVPFAGGGSLKPSRSAAGRWRKSRSAAGLQS
jgi:hypothetical protein